MDGNSTLLNSAPRDHGHAHGGIAVATRGGLKFHCHRRELQHWYQQGRLIIGSLLSPNGRHLVN